MPTREVPDIAAPVKVSLDPATTAILVLDMSDALCGRNPLCVATVPTVRGLLDRARAAGARVIYTLGRAPQNVLPELDRRPGDPVVATSADKYFQTELEAHLRGIATPILVGGNSNGAVLYTAFAASARGLSVIVAEDAISSKDEWGTWVARWQMLNQPGFTNAENKPLAPKAVTLTRTDLIDFARKG